MDQRRAAILLLVLSLLIGITGTWDRAFSTRGEGREAIVAQNIVSSGNWILPSGYGGAVPSKPPAMHWGIALLSIPVGEVSEFTSRLPSVIAMVSFVFLFYRFLCQRGEEQVGFLAALILLSSFEWFRAGTACRVDMLLSATFAGGLITLFTWYERGLLGMPWTSIALLSMATLCKGPVAIVLPAAIFGSFVWFKGSTIGRTALSLIKVFLPVVAIGSLWYIAAYFVGQDRFLDKVYYENIARFLGTTEDEPHKHSVFYLLGSIPIGFAPWSLIAIPFLFFRSVRSKIILSVKGWRNLSPLVLYSLVAVVACTVFFSIPSSKRSVYILPIYPFLSYLVARGFMEFKGEVESIAKRLGKVLVYLGSCLVAVGFAVGFGLKFYGAKILDFTLPVSKNWEMRRVAIEKLVSSWGFFDVVLTALFLCFVLKLLSNRKDSNDEVSWCIKFGFAVALMISFVSWCLIRPLSNEISSKTIIPDIPAEILKSRELLSYKNSFYGFSFYLKRELRTVFEGFPNGATVIMYENQLDSFSSGLVPGQKATVVFTSPLGIENFTRRLLIAQLAP